MIGRTGHLHLVKQQPAQDLINKYVCGFLILVGSTDGPHVALMEKKRPKWQEGCLNGLGGHIKVGETPEEAMVREFGEECRIPVNPDSWRQYARLRGNDTQGAEWEVNFFRSLLYQFNWSWREDYSKTDEPVKIHHLNHLPVNVIPNLRFLIPMAMYSPFNDNYFQFDIQEVAF